MAYDEKYSEGCPICEQYKDKTPDQMADGAVRQGSANRIGNWGPIAPDGLVSWVVTGEKNHYIFTTQHHVGHGEVEARIKLMAIAMRLAAEMMEKNYRIIVDSNPQAHFQVHLINQQKAP